MEYKTDVKLLLSSPLIECICSNLDQSGHRFTHILKSKFGAEKQWIDNWHNLFVYDYNAKKIRL